MAENGDANIISAIRQYEIEASTRSKSLHKDAIKVIEGTKKLSESFSPHHLKLLRQHKSLPDALLDRMRRDILTISALLIKNHPDPCTIPSAHELRNMYIFRYAICGYVLSLYWMIEGRSCIGNTEKARNSLADVTYAAYATFFDGLLTKDKRLSEIYKTTKYLLEYMFP